MNASELKSQVINTDSGTHFFDRSSMKFAGDTMRNFGVRKTSVNCWDGSTKEVFELYRIRPVKFGNQKSFYFDCKTFKRIHAKEG